MNRATQQKRQRGPLLLAGGRSRAGGAVLQGAEDPLDEGLGLMRRAAFRQDFAVLPGLVRVVDC
jgi:hypothetical protein